jgi:hypothetical protein
LDLRQAIESRYTAIMSGPTPETVAIEIAISVGPMPEDQLSCKDADGSREPADNSIRYSLTYSRDAFQT